MEKQSQDPIVTRLNGALLNFSLKKSVYPTFLAKNYSICMVSEAVFKRPIVKRCWFELERM